MDTDQTPKRNAGWPSWRPKFLEMLGKTGNVTLACQYAKVTRMVAYKARKESADFARKWERCIDQAIELLEATAWKRASQGTKEPVWMKDENGKPVKVDEVTKNSDVLLMFLLKAHRPEKYRERNTTELTGPGGGPVQLEAVKQKPNWAEYEKLTRGLLSGGGGNGNGKSVHPVDADSEAVSLPRASLS